jgi:hypothetical protein
MDKNLYFNQCKLSTFIVSKMCDEAKMYSILAKIKAFKKYNFFLQINIVMFMRSSLMNLVAPFCKKVEKLPKCGNWQKCNYVTTISLHRTMKTPLSKESKAPKAPRIQREEATEREHLYWLQKQREEVIRRERIERQNQEKRKRHARKGGSSASPRLGGTKEAGSSSDEDSESIR